jgi:hypothetical protein
MVSIPEQARQNPRNATPIGRDTSEVKYPGVNTCTTITACCLQNLIGMHLGLFMGAGEEGGKGSEQSEIIDLGRLELYLHVLRQHITINGGGPARKIYIAGALDVWKTSARSQWNYLKAELLKLVGNDPSKLSWVQFDDEQSMTVDIFVTWKGVQFSEVDNRAAVVAALPSFTP